jgi:hypothetical protein
MLIWGCQKNKVQIVIDEYRNNQYEDMDSYVKNNENLGIA